MHCSYQFLQKTSKFSSAYFIKNQSAIERENEKHEELQLQKTKVEKLKKDCTLLQSEKKSRIIEIQQQEDLRHEAEAKIDKLENEIKSLRIQNQTYLKEKGILYICPGALQNNHFKSINYFGGRPNESPVRRNGRSKSQYFRKNV